MDSRRSSMPLASQRPGSRSGVHAEIKDRRSVPLQKGDPVRVFSNGFKTWVNATVTRDRDEYGVHVEYEKNQHIYVKTLMDNAKNLFVPFSTCVCRQPSMEILPDMIPKPNLQGADWQEMQVFNMKRDDPYKLEHPWTPPAWVTTTAPKHGISNASARTFLEVEHLGQDQPRECTYNGYSKATVACTIENFLSPAQCIDILDAVNEKGYVPALVNMGGMLGRPGGGDLQFNPERKNVYISMIKSDEFAAWMYARVEPFLKDLPLPGGVRLDHLNSAFRYMCYTEGQHEGPRFDATAPYPEGQAPEGKEGARSCLTMVLYLKDVDLRSGGSNMFFRNGAKGESERGVKVQPAMGRLVIFSQNLWHTSTEMLDDSIKYAIRMEVMAMPTDAVLSRHVKPDEVSSKHVKTSKLVIPQPTLHGADWDVMQIFSMKRDDPYNMDEPWTPPAWVWTLSPKHGVSNASVIHLDVDRLGQDQDRACIYNGFRKATVACVIDDFLSSTQCVELLEAVNQKGYVPGLVNVGGMVGRAGGDDLQYNPDRRNIYISMIKNEDIADWMYRRVDPFLRELPLPGGVRLDHLNPAFRYICYKLGQHEVPRFDATARYPAGKAPEGKEEARSCFTLLLYLKDVDTANSGGGNMFFRKGNVGESQKGVTVVPKMGRLVIFSQNLWHTSKEMLDDSLKYVIRMEVMVMPTDEVLSKHVAPDEPESLANYC